jgi:hypothetical protein
VVENEMSDVGDSDGVDGVFSGVVYVALVAAVALLLAIVEEL